MGGRRVTPQQVRRILDAMPIMFSTDELQAVCEQGKPTPVSFDTLLRKIQKWGWVTREGNEKLGAPHRPRIVFTKNPEAIAAGVPKGVA